ncbi:putative ABC transporter ATP-binding protein YheS [Tepidimonas alkaliphilus]|uniref:Probable ATP-binding protein YheS n=1 Tax=Tepidimonas alkaliphilus TaxID=2588942 RepID=A0A554WAC4_9BURK|nr:ATP-binding cassette domain-containing protein [Tepidimonas alkaliphilus]TSE20527.1 putative ABC transporter ATP-binding protein YheS [Tepidimonas alkaliphilus]
MIVLRDVTLRRGAKVVLERASVTLHAGEKIGLVGRNGAGKSSLFALLLGELHEDAGELQRPRGWRTAHVAQHMPDGAQPATAFVLDGDARLVEARAALAGAEAAGDGEAIALAHARLADAGAHDAPARAQALLLGLGFAPAELEQPVGAFSGGWRMRLQLARALMSPSDLLLLDEPTNHLDLDALVWLEGWLQRYPGTLIVISHDREFLDAVTRVTLHLEGGRLTRYAGGYSAFEEQRAQQQAQQQAAFERQQERIAHLQRFVERFRAKATKARQAQSRLKALARMERVAPVLAEADFSFEFAEPGPPPNPLLVLHDVTAGYRDAASGQARPIVHGVRASLLPGQRIGILGANGQGKSTLVKTLAGVLPPLQGRLQPGRGLRIGYFAQQELEVLRTDETPLEHLQRLARDTEAAGALLPGQSVREQDLRSFLGGFQFGGEAALQPVGTMSGGEKARLVLALLVWQRPNLLLLDEPTNHLDLATREALALALAGFDGTVLLVSHDRALLRRVCDTFWLVAAGRLQPFDGDLDDYQRHLQEVARQRREALAASRKSDSGPAGGARPSAAHAAEPALAPQERRRLQAQQRQRLAERLRPHQREQQALEARMAALQAEQAELQETLASLRDGATIAEAGRRLKALEAELAAAEERWLLLVETIEALQREADPA